MSDNDSIVDITFDIISIDPILSSEMNEFI